MRWHCWVGLGAILAAFGLAGAAAARPRPGPAAPDDDLFAFRPLLQDGDEKPKPPPKHKIEVKLSIEEIDGKWCFRVTGTTDLPSDVKLKGRIFALDEVVLMGEKRKDEEAITTQKGRWYRIFEFKDGKFDEVVNEFARRPYSIEYRARVYYEKDLQDEDVKRRVGDEDFDGFCDLRFGKPEDFDTEVRLAAKDIARDLETVQGMFNELKNTFTRQREKTDLKAWKAWAKGFLERVQELDEKNNERYEIWAVWIERQGKFRIESFCERFTQMLIVCEEYLDGNKERLEQAQRFFENFISYYEEAREVVGIDAPFEVEKVTAETAAYAQAMAEVRRLVEGKDGEAWKKRGDALRAQARAALLKLGDQRLVPRRGYEHLVRLADAFSAVLRRADQSIGGGDGHADLLKSLSEHDAALKAFRDYAGVKP